MDEKVVIEAAVAQLVAAVRSVRERHPQDQVYGAMFHEFYGDGSVMTWPVVTACTEDALMKVAMSYSTASSDRDGGSWAETLRWSGADFMQVFDSEYSVEPGEVEDTIVAQVQEHAARTGNVDAWESEYGRYLRCFPKAAMTARGLLIAEGVVDEQFVAIAADETGDLIPLSLTKDQIRQHFLEYDAP